MGKDRRRQERLDAKLFIELEDKNAGARGRGVVSDVSLSGLAVDTEADLVQNEVLGCHIEIPIYVRAKVVRTILSGQMKRYGLEFVGQSIFEKLILRKLLKGSRKTKKV
jgi:hypothetical protein